MTLAHDSSSAVGTALDLFTSAFNIHACARNSITASQNANHSQYR